MEFHLKTRREPNLDSTIEENKVSRLNIRVLYPIWIQQTGHQQRGPTEPEATAKEQGIPQPLVSERKDKLITSLSASESLTNFGDHVKIPG